MSELCNRSFYINVLIVEAEKLRMIAGACRHSVLVKNDSDTSLTNAINIHRFEDMKLF